MVQRQTFEDKYVLVNGHRSRNSETLRKLSNIFLNQDKGYVAEIFLGEEKDTDDLEGEGPIAGVGRPEGLLVGVAHPVSPADFERGVLAGGVLDLLDCKRVVTQ